MEATQATPNDAADEHRLQWTYPRVRPWQYVAVGLQTAANVYIEVASTPKPDETWRETLPLDESIRSWLRADTQQGRDRAESISDVIWYGTQYYTVVVDSWIVPLIFDDLNTDVALQLTMINWQAMGFSGVLARLAHMTIGRPRPPMHGCSPDPNAEFPCRPTGTSFFSGHTSMVTTGAALACAHHAALPLYGKGPAGAITCGVLAAGAVTVGALRVVADRHWYSDVLVGHVLGAAVGLGFPWLLHYGHPITPDLSALGVSHVAWVPFATSDRVSLGLSGFF